MRFRNSIALLTVIAMALHAEAGLIVDVTASSAPNFTAAAGAFSGYSLNAVGQLATGGGNLGDRLTDPTAYEPIADGATVSVTENIVSDFPSWRGQADAPVPFHSEFGNRIHFGLRISSDGLMDFSLDDIFFEMESLGDGGALSIGPFSLGDAGVSFSDIAVGIDYGLDNTLGGGDDTVYNTSNPAASSTLIDEFVYIGVGNAYDASGFPGAPQDRIDGLLRILPMVNEVSAMYTVNDGINPIVEGSTTVFLANAIPEPSALFAFGVGLVAVASRRRRRQR